MISFSAVSFDLNGQVILQHTEASDVFAQSRRVSRAETLDGGVSLSDLGFTHGDRTLGIRSNNVSQSTHESISYLQRTYPQLLISIHEGLFLGAIENINIRNGVLFIRYLVKEKLTAEAI